MPHTQQAHWEYTEREWSNEPFTKILEALPEIHILYDIGANVGAFTHILTKKFPDLISYCWEPYKPNYDYLKEKVANCFPEGIFYGQSKTKLLGRGDGNIGGLFVQYINAGLPQVEMEGEAELRELESYDIPKPDLIKLDVEGAEENIIEFSKIVKECPNLIIEWHPDKNAQEFFEKHLPNHYIKVNLEDKQYLLCLKSQ